MMFSGFQVLIVPCVRLPFRQRFDVGKVEIDQPAEAVLGHLGR
jgi:hypothetical protein